MQIKELIEKIKQAKFDENFAKLEREGYETLLFEELTRQKLNIDEGAVKLDGATVSYKMTRSVDQKILSDYDDSWPDSVKKCIKWKADLDLKSFRGVQEFDKDGFSIISKYVTTKPAKPSIKFNDEEQ